MFRSRAVFLLAYGLCAAASISLEVLWMRLLTALLGSTLVATSCVLAAVMGGMGAGAWLASRRADRLLAPGRWFALAQALSGLLGLLPLLLLRATGGGSLALALALGVVGLASVPAGMAFPLAIRVRVLDGTERGAGAGRLYAADALGGMLGALGAGLLLLPWLGVRASVGVMAGLKIAVALGVGRRRRVPRQNEEGQTVEPQREGAVPIGWLALAAAQGFCLLGAEVLWVRLLSFVLFKGATTYAFSGLLGVVLWASGMGALWGGRLGRTAGPPQILARAGHLSLACAASLLSSLWILTWAVPVPSSVAVNAFDGLWMVLTCAPGSFLSGAVFALLCQGCQAARAARGAGALLSVNTLGGVMGALSVPLWLVPAFGLGATLAGLGVGLGLTAWTALRGTRRPWRLQSASLALLVFAAVALVRVGPRWTRHFGTAVFYQEGPDATVMVTEREKGNRRLYVDGIAVAGTDLMMSIDQKTLAHLPVFLHPHPRSVLTVGFGSGGTSASLLLHPGIEVSCAEISPTVTRAAPYFAAINRGVLASPPSRYRLVLEDARTFLARTKQRFDIIVNDCTDLAYRSDAALYSLETFRLLRARLAEGGLAAVWLPLRGEAPYRVLGSVIGTFGEVFPHMSLWVFSAFPVHFGVLVGSAQPLTPSLGRIRALLAQRELGEDVSEIGLEDPFQWLAAHHQADAALRRFSRGIARHTDDRPVVEFWAPGESGGDESAYEALSQMGPSSPAVVSDLAPADRERLGQVVAARPWLLAGHEAYLRGDADRARVSFLQALRLDPGDGRIRTLLGMRAEPVGSGVDLFAEGARSLLEGHPSLAQQSFLSLVRLHPGHAGASLGLGLSHLALGDCQAARKVLEGLAGSSQVSDLAQKGLRVARLPAPLCRAVWALTFAGL